MTRSWISLSLALVMYSAWPLGYQMLRMRPGGTGTMAPGGGLEGSVVMEEEEEHGVFSGGLWGVNIP